MNWDLAAVLAELISAVAVVVTLVYLSVQIRLGREASQVQSSYSTMEIYGGWRSHLIENERLAATLAKANRGEAITEGEEIQIAMLMDDLFLTAAVSHASGVKAGVLYDSTGEVEYIERLFRQNPSMAPYWERTRGYIMSNLPDFANQLDAHLANKSFPYLVPDSDVTK